MSDLPYIALARKWRPRQFSEVIGQNPVILALSHAITRGRLHHAYVFSGSRGVGKTSLARIFAKCIICNNKGFEIYSTCCDICSTCQDIAASRAFDVMEIDGASHNGVDAIRELRDIAQYIPSSGKRIFIIDEAHMLSGAAFNALLKILEEPPPHVLFIFATTEVHKLPATVLSRCQHFACRQVGEDAIGMRLEQILKAEEVIYEQATIPLLARAAAGSMRDALSLLDQVLALSPDLVSIDALRESIGLLDSTMLLQILEAIFDRKPRIALDTARTIIRSGVDIKLFTESLMSFLHAIVLAKIGGTERSLLEHEQKECGRIANKRPLEEMELMFQVLAHGLTWMTRSAQQGIILEMLLIKCAAAESLLMVGNTPPPQDTEPFIQDLQSRDPHLAAVINQAARIELQGGLLTMAFPSNTQSLKTHIESRGMMKELLLAAKTHFGPETRLDIHFDATDPSRALKKHQHIQQKQAQMIDEAQKHPLLVEALALFGGQLGSIELKPTS